MSFIKYDIALLILFVLFISVFLYRNKKNLKKDGLLFLYRTKWGIKLIDTTAKRFPKTLSVLSYISIATGYLLMLGMIYLFVRIAYLYIALPEVVKAIKIPPIMPIVPYIDKIVPDAIPLPSFYFIYFIVILAIVAISHEFAHGIFMRKYKIHIKSTGFGFFPFFLPVFLAAFVEQDEKSMQKATRFQQKAVLAAGTFANLITATIFFLIMILFFSLAFSPSGVIFSNYAYGAVTIGSIYSVNNVSISDATYENLLEVVDDKKISRIESSEGNFLLTKELLEMQGNQESVIVAYFDAPAINSGLSGAILEIDGEKIVSFEKLSEALGKYSAGDKINVKTTQGEYEVILETHPVDKERVWLGVTFSDSQGKGVFGKIISYLVSFREPHVFYESKIGAGDFVYNFLWWAILISFSVALVNMLPMGIFDGGRFFYLTVWTLSGSEKFAKKSFALITYFLLLLLLILMVFWVFSFVGMPLAR